MIALLPLALAAACAVPMSAPTSVPAARSVANGEAMLGVNVADSSYRRLFERGVTMEQFLAAAKSRREQWLRNYGDAIVPDALVTKGGAVAGPWKLLVVAVDGCSDSVNTIPYIAKLAEKIPGVELRIVDSDVGRSVMDAHRTPDGRGATPTVILLDGSYEERGCWIERPAELREWMLENKGKVKDSELFERKMAWYAADKGEKTMAEIAAMLEAAGRGERVC
jgi:hypothetical protein